MRLIFIRRNGRARLWLITQEGRAIPMSLTTKRQAGSNPGPAEGKAK